MPVTMSNPTFSRYVPVVPYYFASDPSVSPVTWADMAIPSKSSPNDVIIPGIGSNAIHILEYDSSFNYVTQSLKITPASGYSVAIPSSSASYINVDTSGNIYVMLQADNGVNIHDGLVKINSSGSVVWQIKFPVGLSFPQAFKVASDGAIYGVVNAAGIGITVFKLNSDGTTSWAKNLGWPGEFNPGYLITISESDSMIYLGGVLVVGAQTGHNITKISMAGTVQWTRTATFTGRDTQLVSALNVYNDASVVVVSGITQDPSTPRDEAFLTGLNSSTGLNNFSIRTTNGGDKAMFYNGTTIDSGNRMYTVFDMGGTAYLWVSPAGGGASYRKSLTNMSWYLTSTFVDTDQRLGILGTDLTTTVAKVLTKLPTNNAAGSNTYSFLPDGSTNVSYVYANTTAFSTAALTPSLDATALTTDTTVSFNTSSNSFFTVQAHTYTFTGQRTAIIL